MPDSDTNPPLPRFKPSDTDCTITAILVELRHNRAIMRRIEEQTTKTNGRVTKLEVDSQVSKAKIYAAVAVLTFIGGFAQWVISTGLHKFIP